MQLWGKGALALIAAVTVGGCRFDPSGINQDVLDPDGGIATVDARPDGDPDGAPPASDGGSLPDAAVSSLGAYRAARVATPPTLDGERTEWPEAGFVTFNIADSAIRVGEHPSYVNSATVRFAMSHDATNIYAFLDVSDDRLIDNSTELYDDDAVAIYFDANGDRSGPYGQDDHEILISSSGFFADTGPNGVNLEISGDVQTNSGGYVIEIAITKASLSPQASTVLGFDLALIDDDDLGSTAADMYGVWFEQPVPHCTACCPGGTGRPWCDTTFFGTVELLP